MNRSKIIHIFLIAFCASNIWTNPASLDTSYNGTGLATITAFTGSATGSVLQPDGKLVVSGYTTPTTPTNKFVLARFNTDGSLDATFNSLVTPGYVIASFVGDTGNNAFSALAIDSNENIVVVGSFNTNTSIIARYLPNGTLDTCFNYPHGFLKYAIGKNSSANSIVIQPNGMILVGGWSAHLDGYWSGYVARFTTAGQFDLPFGVSDHYSNNRGYSTVNPFGYSKGITNGQTIALQPNGDILLCGTTIQYSNNEKFAYISRLNGTTGALDRSFGGNGTGWVATQFGLPWTSNGIIQIPSSSAIGMQLTHNNEIIITGAASNSNSPINSQTPDTSMFIARYSSAGILDTTFNSTGSTSLYVGAATTGYGITISATDNITVVGSAIINNNPSTQFIARYNHYGLLDTTLHSSGFLLSSIIYNSLNLSPYISIIGYQPPVQADGKLIIIGQFNGSNLAVSRYLDGLIPFSPTSSIGLHGQNSNYISHFLMIDFYAQVITDPLVQAAAIASINAIITTYAQNYICQLNFNFISYLHLLEAQINNTQANLIAAYPNSTTEINQFFVYINARITTLNNL